MGAPTMCCSANAVPSRFWKQRPRIKTRMRPRNRRAVTPRTFVLPSSSYPTGASIGFGTTLARTSRMPTELSGSLHPKTSNAGKGGDASAHSARRLGEGRQHWPLPTSQEYYVGVLGSEADLCFNLRIEDNALLSKRFGSAPFGLTPGRIRDEEDFTCHD